MAFILNDAKRVVGRISNTGANNYTIHATLEERSTDIATNTSSLYYKVWLTADNDSYVTDIDGNTKYMSGWAFDNGNITAYININGSSFASAQNSNFSMGYPGYGYSYPSSVTILEGTKSIAHNDKGELTVAVTAGITNNNNYGATPASGSMSKTAPLTTIARKSTMTATNATLGGSVTFSITSKSSAFTHAIYASCGSWTNNNQPVSYGGAWTVPDLSGYFTSSETSKAVNFTLYTYNGSTTVGSSTASCTISLPGKNTSSKQSVQLGSSKSIPITKAYSSYKSTVEYTLNGGSSWTRIGDAQTTGTSVSFSPAASLGSNFPTEMSHTYTFRVTTYANSTGGYRSLGSNTYDLTLTIPDYQPSVSFTTARIKNDNSTIDGWGVAVKGYTKYEYAATSTNYYGATTASWSFSCGGRTKSGSSGTTDAFTTTGSSTPAIVVTDSRGKQNSAKASAVTIYDYGAPVIISSYAYRSDANGNRKDDGTCMARLINAKTDYTCGGKNTIFVTARTYIDGAWQNCFELTNNVRSISSPVLDITKTYRFEMRVVDSLGGTKSVTYTIPTASVSFNIKEGGKGSAFFGYAQQDGILEVNGGIDATQNIRVIRDDANANLRLRYSSNAKADVSLAANTSGDIGLWDSGFSDWLFVRNPDGHAEINFPLRVQGHSSAIGNFLSASKDMKVANQTWGQGAGLTLGRGTWVFAASAEFANNANGDRLLRIYGTSEYNLGNSVSYRASTSSNASRVNMIRVLNVNFVDQIDMYSWAYQSSGSTLDVSMFVTAIRIS